jgi:hypothetical protein
MHYAPIQATVEGEPPEVFAFLGSGRLEEPLNRYAVTVVWQAGTAAAGPKDAGGTSRGPAETAGH